MVDVGLLPPLQGAAVWAVTPVVFTVTLQFVQLAAAVALVAHPVVALVVTVVAGSSALVFSATAAAAAAAAVAQV